MQKTYMYIEVESGWKKMLVKEGIAEVKMQIQDRRSQDRREVIRYFTRTHG